jgi:hypothetical protein
MSEPVFENFMNHFENQTWKGFKNILENILGNTRRPDYKDIVQVNNIDFDVSNAIFQPITFINIRPYKNFK